MWKHARGTQVLQQLLDVCELVFGVLRLCCVPQPTFTILGLARLAPLATLHTS